MRTLAYVVLALFAVVVISVGTVIDLGAQPTAAVAVDADDIGGVVRSPKGPEAGVWVIAETTELPTRFTKMVVTDGQGRYVIPDLPPANYSVWVRGYGLVDSPRVRAKPGQHLNLAAVPAPDGRAAAHYYPAIYWYAMMKMPPATMKTVTKKIPATAKNIPSGVLKMTSQLRSMTGPLSFIRTGSRCGGSCSCASR